MPQKRKPMTVRWRFWNDGVGQRDSYNVRCREFNARSREDLWLELYYSDIREPHRRYRNWKTGTFRARVLPDTVRVVDVRGNRNALEMEVIPVIYTEAFGEQPTYEDDPRWV